MIKVENRCFFLYKHAITEIKNWNKKTIQSQTSTDSSDICKKFNRFDWIIRLPVLNYVNVNLPESPPDVEAHGVQPEESRQEEEMYHNGWKIQKKNQINMKISAKQINVANPNGFGFGRFCENANGEIEPKQRFRNGYFEKGSKTDVGNERQNFKIESE